MSVNYDLRAFHFNDNNNIISIIHMLFVHVIIIFILSMSTIIAENDR